MINGMDWQSLDLAPFVLSIKLSLVTTVILLVVSFPLAYALARTQFRFKMTVDSLVTMPLVLPPSVLGFYILIALAPSSPIGSFFLSVFDIRLVFSFTGMVIASCLFSLPLMVQPLKNGLESTNRSIWEAAYTLGKSKLETLFRVVIPNMKSSIIGACIITFAHTMGEFGIILMIGGNIPGETRVASVAIYDKVEQLDFMSAHMYSLILVALSFGVLFTVNVLNRKRNVYQVL